VGTFKLTIAYDGAGFVGWQRQASGTSIQGLLEDALSDLDGRQVAVTGAGRTDAGVHAIGQVASVSIARAIDGDSLVGALNARLPRTVRVTFATAVDEGFHARFHARSKTYRYRIWNTEVPSPFERAYAWHVPGPALNVETMAEGAAVFQGRHDFAAFQATGAETQGTDRVMFSSRVFSSYTDRARGFADRAGGFADCALGFAESAPLITFEICGDGFLRHMVRTMIGTLVEVGRERKPVEWIAEILASRERARAGPTAPPEGLFLVHVEYP
jgi:tRNA pseudouridine38-40 synthase